MRSGAPPAHPTTAARRLFRLPLVHFVAIGALFFVADGFRSGLIANEDAEERDHRITITRDEIDELRAEFTRQMRRPPAPDELDRMIADRVDEEILFREAIALGWLERDGGVQTRLIQKMLFLEGGQTIEDPAGLLARANLLELHRGDVVVRRILVQKMRLMGSALDADEGPTAEEIAERYAEREESLREPDRVDLVHVFLSTDLHGEQTLERARALGRRLDREQIEPPQALALGDVFPLGHRLEARSARDLQRSFGARFGEQVLALPKGRWSPPIASAYGQHLVRVEARRAGRLPPIDTVSDRLRRELEQEDREAKLDALLSRLRKRYEVVREDGDPAAENAMAASPTG